MTDGPIRMPPRSVPTARQKLKLIETGDMVIPELPDNVDGMHHVVFRNREINQIFSKFGIVPVGLRSFISMRERISLAAAERRTSNYPGIISYRPDRADTPEAPRSFL